MEFASGIKNYLNFLNHQVNKAPGQFLILSAGVSNVRAKALSVADLLRLKHFKIHFSWPLAFNFLVASRARYFISEVGCINFKRKEKKKQKEKRESAFIIIN